VKSEKEIKDRLLELTIEQKDAQGAKAVQVKSEMDTLNWVIEK